MHYTYFNFSIFKIKYHILHRFFSFFYFFDKYANLNKYYLENCVSSCVLKNLWISAFLEIAII